MVRIIVKVSPRVVKVKFRERGYGIQVNECSHQEGNTTLCRKNVVKVISIIAYPAVLTTLAHSSEGNTGQDVLLVCELAKALKLFTVVVSGGD